MNRAITIAAVLLALAGITGCIPRSEAWEQQMQEWPEDVDMGGTPAEWRQYHEGDDNFEQMLAAEHEVAEH